MARVFQFTIQVGYYYQYGYRCNSKLEKENASFIVQCNYDENMYDSGTMTKRREDAIMKCAQFIIGIPRDVS